MSKWISVHTEKPIGYQHVFIRLRKKKTREIRYAAAFWDIDHFELLPLNNISGRPIPDNFIILQWMSIPEIEND